MPSFAVEKLCVKKGGEIACVRNRISLLPEQEERGANIIVFSEDITPRQQAMKELTNQKEILQKIFDHIPVMVNFIGEDNRIKLVNREWERTLGWSLEEIISQQLGRRANWKRSANWRAEEASEPIGAPLRKGPAYHPATVLLVEDETPVRDFVRRLLANEGYTVLEAPNGEEALRLSEKHAGRIDLLLSDIVMPGMSGPDLFRGVSGLYPEIKVLYMSGYSDETVVRHVALEGIAIVKKPFAKDELITRIQHLLQGKGSVPDT